MKSVGAIPAWMRSLREYREQCAGLRVAKTSSALERLGDELAANARVPPAAASRPADASTLENLGYCALRREVERSALEKLRIEAEGERGAAFAAYDAARRDRQVLDRLLLRRCDEVSAYGRPGFSGEDAP